MPTSRRCGNCTACCTTHEVYELSKPRGVACAHCIPDKGCLIYPGRPQGCRKFDCQWLKGFGRDKDRPNRSGVVVDFYKLGDPPKEISICAMYEVFPGALKKRFAEKVGRDALGEQMLLFRFPLNKRPTLLVPRWIKTSEVDFSALPGDVEIQQL